MKCRDFEELLSAYADGELAQTQRDFIEEHLTDCTECRATLTRYQQTDEQLISLRKVPHVVSDRDSIMSRIKSETTKRQLHWLRPVIAGSLAIVIIFIFSILFTMPDRAPENVLAQALANTQNLKSYRVSDISYDKDISADKWIAVWYKDVDYAGQGNFHTKVKFLPSLSIYNSSENWITWESIVSDNTGYTWNSTPSFTSFTSMETVNDLFSKETISIQQPMDSLKILANIDKLADEEIDGVTCFHYHGLVDIDAWLKQHMIEYKEIRPNASSELIRLIEQMWRSKKLTYDFWIGKSDNLLHQWSQIIGDSFDSLEDDKEVFRYYDFNQNIVVEPPLDAQGNLLPDWRIQEE